MLLIRVVDMALTNPVFMELAGRLDKVPPFRREILNLLVCCRNKQGSIRVQPRVASRRQCHYIHSSFTKFNPLVTASTHYVPHTLKSLHSKIHNSNWLTYSECNTPLKNINIFSFLQISFTVLNHV